MNTQNITALITYLVVLVSTIVAAYLKVLPIEYVAPIFTGVIGLVLPSPVALAVAGTTTPTPDPTPAPVPPTAVATTVVAKPIQREPFDPTQQATQSYPSYGRGI